MHRSTQTQLVAASLAGRPTRLAVAIALLALDLAAAASLTLPAVRGQLLATEAMSAVAAVPELPVTLQSLPNSCGPAVVATLATWLGADVTEDAVLTQAALLPGGISLGEFARLAALHGIEGAWFQVGSTALAHLATPFAVHLTRAGRGHFVLVLHVSGQLALVADPAEGGLVVPLAHLAAEFAGRVFVLRRSAA